MTSVAQPSTALARVESMSIQPLARIEDLRTKLDELRGRVNLVCPVSSVDSILPMHQISLRVVVIDSTITNQASGNGPEVYKGKFCEPNERALGKVALEKIDAAAGVQLLGRRRLDDRSDPFYCEIEVMKGLREFDGTWRQTTKTKAVDLRDGSPDAIKLKGSPATLADNRSKIQELAETKAGLRATRTLLSLRQKYTTDELAKAFVVPKLVPCLDPSDPDQKQALLAMATGRETALFGPRPGDTVRELKDVTPAPALPPPGDAGGTPPPPVGAVPPAVDEPETDGGEGGDFEVLDLAAAPEIVVCGCPCGDQRALDSETVRITTEKLGAPRCKSCFPGRSFDFTAHKDVRGTLQIPKTPGLTADAVRKAQENSKAGK